MDSREDIEQLVPGARKLAAAIRTHFISRLPNLAMSDIPDNVSALVARFVLERQTEALRAAVTLAGQSLGHLALPMVRPACEERIWTAYLYAMDESLRDRLLVLMSALESSAAVTAQQQFLGAKTMRRLGFPKPFVREQLAARKRLEEELAAIGGGLGWPEDTRGIPSIGWVASQTNLDQLYAFLYTATSKGVHFSVSEASRSGWSSSLEPESEVVLMAEPYRRYRTAFSLHWLCSLLLDTSIVVAEHGPLAKIELGADADHDMLQAAQLIGSAGRVPILLASEFNLPPSEER